MPKGCLFCLVRQKHSYNNFAFNQSYLAKGKKLQWCFCLMRQNKNSLFYTSGSGLDRTDDFQKIFGPGLDWKISQSAHLWCELPKSTLDASFQIYTGCDLLQDVSKFCFPWQLRMRSPATRNKIVVIFCTPGCLLRDDGHGCR